MSGGRFRTVFAGDFSQTFKRPIFWVLIVVLGLTAWGLAGGSVRIMSGDATVGGTKAWLTSEFAQAQMLSMVIFIFYMFFLAIAAGMAVIRDDEHRVGEILHSTPLTPGEYLWGKFWAVMAGFGIVLVLHILFTIFFNHVFPTENADEIRGPLNPLNYIRPALVFGIPALTFLGGTCFAIGTLSRRPILVFLIPVAALLFCAFFLWEWSPSWLDPRINKVLQLAEPAGFRWLNETWLKVDRGVEFYNTAPVGYDLPFLLSRLGFVVLGLASVAWAQFRFARGLRGVANIRRRNKRLVEPAPAALHVDPAPATPISSLGMSGGRVGILHGVLSVANYEYKELIKSPGLYLFVPIILIQIIGNAYFATGAFDTPMLLTSGYLAASSMNTITLLVCLLLLFYTVESMARERNTGLAQIYYTTPVRSASILFGKALANTLVGAGILLFAFLGCVVLQLIQHRTAVDARPFLLTWILLLVPTFLVWSAFVMTVQAVLGNRYATYTLGLGVLILTGYKQTTGKMTWVWNWDIWNAVRWSDLGTFQLNGFALLLNRLFVLALTGFLIALCVRIFDRRGRDAARYLDRLRPRPLLKGALVLAPFWVAAIVLGVVLYMQVAAGFQGKPAEKAAKDYWRANVATWKDAPLPSIEHADMDITLHPGDRRLDVTGTYRLVNLREDALTRFPLTAGASWDSLKWTLNGEPYEPQAHAGLFVITPNTPMGPGSTLEVGWTGSRQVPKGATKNGGGVEEFILPMGTVLTSFSASFAPILGYEERIGVDKDNRYDSKVFPPDHYKGFTHAGFGSDRPFTTRIRVTAPEEYVLNSVGTLVDESVASGLRTAVWESDHPVSFFNVVAGKWDVRRGENTVIYYHPGHEYNIDEMIEALDGARKYYSEWFYEYPWKELKISEFANLASYAQGFPTNITFSEGIGFLNKSDPKANVAFLVVAHESAHQWWGNILVPGEGPGGDILSEGMAHFSTVLLFDQIKGLGQRIAFCTQIENRYGERRQKDSEKPLNQIDGTKPGDTTVTYDKAGMVFWMLLNHLGREPGLAGYKDFIHRYSDGHDHALIEDFVAVMREHAEDKEAFDAFAKEWFYEVVVPEYKLREVKKEQSLSEGDLEVWEVTARVENTGTGTMPVEIAASAGERFPKEDAKPAVDSAGGWLGPQTAEAAEGEPASSYREARTTVVLAAGESREIKIRCGFDPERVVVDPDVLVLQLNRELAIHRF